MKDVEIGERSGKVRVRQAVRAYCAVRPQPAGKVSALFVSQRDEAVTASGVWRMLSMYAQQVRLEHISPHVLRHSFASLLLREQQIDPVTVADLLGHQSVNITMRYIRSPDLITPTRHRC